MTTPHTGDATTGPIPLAAPGGTLLGSLQQLRTVLGELDFPLNLSGSGPARAERQAMLAQLDDYVLPRLESVDAPLLAVVGGSTGAGKSTLVNSLLGFPASRSSVIRPTTRAPVLVHHPADTGYFAEIRTAPADQGGAPDPKHQQQAPRRPAPQQQNAQTANPQPAGAQLEKAPARSAPDRAGPGGPAGATAGGRARILPSLARSSFPVELAADAPITALQLIPTEAVPPGLALLDAPDIDSVVESNRALASQLLAAADLWVFVTTAARYADAVPWDFLAGAAARQAAVALVLDRVPPDTVDEVAGHLHAMMAERGLGGSPLFVVPETAPNEQGLLPPPAVQPLKNWLGALAHDAVTRQAVVRQTLSGAVEALSRRARELAGAVDHQQQAVAALGAQVDEVYTVAQQRISQGLADGSLLRTEVLARWQEFLGTGEFMRNLESRIGRIRDRIVSAVTGKPRQAEEVGQALQSGVEQLIAGQAELAADEVARRWQQLPGGASVLAAHPDIARTAPGLLERVSRTVRDWQADVFAMVSDEGKEKRTAARILSYGVNGTGVALMLVTFSQTAGLSGAEIGIAGGTAVLAQRLLEAVFGDQAVRTLVQSARKDLSDRADQILAIDRTRLDTVLTRIGSGPTASSLRGAADDIARQLASSLPAEPTAGTDTGSGAGDRSLLAGIGGGYRPPDRTPAPAPEPQRPRRRWFRRSRSEPGPNAAAPGEGGTGR